MTTPTITFIPDANELRYGQLIVSGGCSLEELHNHPQCPRIIKATLETHVSWQMRCETLLHQALNLKNQFLPFRAAVAVYGVEGIDKNGSITMTIDDARTGFSMVRPTPAHTPIVTAFVHLHQSGEIVEECKIAITGIEKRKLTLPEPTALHGLLLSSEEVDNWSKDIIQQYQGFDDFNGSEEYRKAMAIVSIQRAFAMAAQEVNNG